MVTHTSPSKKLIVIAGPTASGKTNLSIELARSLNCPILSADSRQFYKELCIGTAKPHPTEMKGVQHYFIDSHSVTTPITAGQFENLALDQLNRIFQHQDFAILVGGSGMFIDAVVYGLDPLPHSAEIREKWNTIYQEKGIAFLLKQLKELDPEYYVKVDKSNPIRVIRALEIIELTGKPYSIQRNRTTQQRPFETYYFVLDHPRDILYQRINLRVIDMINDGLVDEVKNLISHRNLQPLNTVGYKEIFQYLDGKFSLDQAVEEIQKNTRRYAKRQLTWFRRNPNTFWIPFSSTQTMQEIILEKTNATT